MPGLRYLERRGIDSGLAKDAGVRYSTDWFGRPALLFPVLGRTGEVIAWHGRHTDGGEPRMHDDGPKSAGLFSTPGALEAAPLVLVEAPLDALSLAACGIPAAATCGTSWPDWLPSIAAFHDVALAFDADAAGDDTAEKLAFLLTSFGARVRRWRPAGAKDWNEALCSAAGMPCRECATTGAYDYVPAHLKGHEGRWTCDSDTHASHSAAPNFACPALSGPLPLGRSYEIRNIPQPELSVDPQLVVKPSSSPSPRCRHCGHGMNVVAVRDICGRCALREAMPQIGTRLDAREDAEDERHLRGRMLAALDRCGYPSLHLDDGTTVSGPGLMEWGPVLREMNLVALQNLERILARSTGHRDEASEP